MHFLRGSAGSRRRPRSHSSSCRERARRRRKGGRSGHSRNGRRRACVQGHRGCLGSGPAEVGGVDEGIAGGAQTRDEGVTGAAVPGRLVRATVVGKFEDPRCPPPSPLPSRPERRRWPRRHLSPQGTCNTRVHSRPGSVAPRRPRGRPLDVALPHHGRRKAGRVGRSHHDGRGGRVQRDGVGPVVIRPGRAPGAEKVDQMSTGSITSTCSPSHSGTRNPNRRASISTYSHGTGTCSSRGPIARPSASAGARAPAPSRSRASRRRRSAACRPR